MPAIVRKGDTSTHGGAITTGSDKWTCMGQAIARVGDILACPIHGPNPIVEGSGIDNVTGQKVARTGDATACGASVISGQSKWFCD